MKMLSPILTINGGSSSIKFALFETHPLLQCTLRGSMDRIGFSESTFLIEEIETKQKILQPLKIPDATTAADILMTWLHGKSFSLIGIGHRIVHGGAKYHQPELINEEMIQELRRLSIFDPDHLPIEIFFIEVLQKKFPSLPQIACFDTAFHYDLPRVAQLVPIPRSYEARGIKRYGFHGLSCSFLIEELKRAKGAAEANKKIILAHLGNGASLTAVHHGKSVDTTMGFSPTSGIMMGTRSGDLDPELTAFLAETEQMTTQQFQEMVNKKSGLLGVSEISSDLRDLLAVEQKDIRATEAIALFCYQIKKQIGAFAAALHGLETLIFSGGIGEHAPLIRQRICNGLDFLGIKLDEEKNQKNEFLISSKKSRVNVHVISTDEELMLAKSVIPFL